jgi:hypothetical protein
MGFHPRMRSRIEKIADGSINRQYDPHASQGIAGRNTDNPFIKQVVKWSGKRS